MPTTTPKPTQSFDRYREDYEPLPAPKSEGTGQRGFIIVCSEGFDEA